MSYVFSRRPHDIDNTIKNKGVATNARANLLFEQNVKDLFRTIKLTAEDRAWMCYKRECQSKSLQARSAHSRHSVSGSFVRTCWT
jgi:hypothetical protein